ncbi:cytochrome P450 [Microbispora sp. H10836]|uniref:cytochrome P450 n=1 Tax=Microbispora sp. H10836 TaxID=2729106 RepID=UPI001472F8D2|nr:cytochrome P450 [Microbispora sp. H10836]
MIPDSLSSSPLEPLITREYDTEPALVHERLRSTYGPVAPVDLLGVPVWFVLGYDEVLHVLQNAGERWSKCVANWRAFAEGRVPADWPPLTLLAADNTGFQDGDRHREGRAAWDAALRPYQDPAHPQAQAMERAILRYCDELVDVITEGTSTGLADLCAQYGRLLPLMVAGHLFGISIDRGDNLVMDLWRLLDGPDSGGAFQRLYATFLELATVKRRRPGEDVPSYLLAAKPDFTDDELARELFLLPAFLDFTGSLICNAVVEMITNPRLRAALSTGAIEEVVNRVAMLKPAIANVTLRYARAEAKLGNFTIAAGDPVLLSVAAANADPRMASALSDDTVRSTRAHLSWGAGPHRCPSRRLATQITTIAVRRLLERFAALGLALPPDQLPWRPSPFMRALRALPVQYEVRPASGPRDRSDAGISGSTDSPGSTGGEGGRQPSGAPAAGDRPAARSALWTFLRRLRGGRRDDQPGA